MPFSLSEIPVSVSLSVCPVLPAQSGVYCGHIQPLGDILLWEIYFVTLRLCFYLPSNLFFDNFLQIFFIFLNFFYFICICVCLYACVNVCHAWTWIRGDQVIWSLQVAVSPWTRVLGMELGSSRRAATLSPQTWNFNYMNFPPLGKK